MSTYVYAGGLSNIYDYPTLSKLLVKATLKIIAQFDNKIVFIVDGFGTVSEMVERHARHMRIGVVRCKNKGQEARYKELNAFLKFKQESCNIAAIWFTREGFEQNPPLTDKQIPVIRFRYKKEAKGMIGITERGDPRFDDSWISGLDKVDFAIIISKGFGDIAFCDKILAHKDKLMLHVTCTGFGGTVVEKNVPTPEQTLAGVNYLLDHGFPASRMVLRVDPMVPTQVGIQTAKKVFDMFRSTGIRRLRLSVMDMYPHTKERLRAAGIKLPYEEFTAPQTMINKIRDFIREYGYYEYESCAEFNLGTTVGCISQKDVTAMGMTMDLGGTAHQRRGCLCPKGKTELLKHMYRCQHGCLYCYWRDSRPM